MKSIFQAINSKSPAQAAWGLHVITPAGGMISKFSCGFWNGQITYTSELEAEQQETTEAQNPIEVKGGDKQKAFSITVEVNKLATGQDPLTVHALWVRSIGKTAPFMLGLTPLDKCIYRLKGVTLNIQNAYFAPDGTVYRAQIGLDFEEDTILRNTAKGIEKKAADSAEKTACNVGPKKAAKQAQSIWD